MISNFKVIVLYLTYTQLSLYLFSHIDFIVNPEIIIGDAKEVTEVGESRDDPHIKGHIT